MIDYKILLYIFLGVTPSLIWLFYYLGKDIHPEPKKMILKIFLWGAVSTIPVLFIQIGLENILIDVDKQINLSSLVYYLIYYFLIISLSEELFKYLVVKFKVLNSPEMDEPLDIMLYMAVSALGFAALENILYLFNSSTGLSIQELMKITLTLALVRFVGATFLHTLCSAVIGYAVAISLCDRKNRRAEAIFGVIIAVFLHGLYNLAIISLQGYNILIANGVILITLAILTFIGFERLKKIKSVTILN